MFDRYNITSARDLAEGVERLGAYLTIPCLRLQLGYSAKAKLVRRLGIEPRTY